MIFYWMYMMWCRLVVWFKGGIPEDEQLRIAKAGMTRSGNDVGINLELIPGNKGVFFDFVAYVDEMLSSKKVDNFITIGFHSPRNGFLEVTIQKKDGLTPAEKIIELQNRIKWLEDLERINSKINFDSVQEQQMNKMIEAIAAKQAKPKRMTLVRNKSRVA